MPYLLIIIFIWFFLGYFVSAAAWLIVTPVMLLFYFVPPFSLLREYGVRGGTLFWYMLDANGRLFSLENRLDALWRYGASRRYLCSYKTWQLEGYWAAKTFYDITGYCPSFWEAVK